MNCINCSKRSWKNSWRSSVQELFECFYFCWNKMVIFGPFGTIEPLCTSSNQNNTKMVLFHWTNYFILSLIDFLKSRFGSRESHFSDENLLLVFLLLWNRYSSRKFNVKEKSFQNMFSSVKKIWIPILKRKNFQWHWLSTNDIPRDGTFEILKMKKKYLKIQKWWFFFTK